MRKAPWKQIPLEWVSLAIKLKSSNCITKKKREKKTVKVYTTLRNNLQEMIFIWANPGLIPYRHCLILHMANQGLQEM